MAYQVIPSVEVDELWDEDDFNLVGEDFAVNTPDIFTAAGQIGAASGANALVPVDPGADSTALVANSAGAGGVGWAGGVVQVGMIIIWSGIVASIPSGWALCDGSNGTPDLRGKFVPGAGSAYSPGYAGGGAVNLQHGHTPDQANTDNHDWSAHTHTQGSSGSGGGHSHTVAANVTNGPSATQTAESTGTTGWASADTHTHTFQTPTSTQAAHTHTNPDTDAGGAAHGHPMGVTGNSLNTSYIPPYYALAFIMRIS